MKRLLILVLVLMMAMPIAAQAATNCSSQFGNCAKQNCTGAGCPKSVCVGANCPNASCSGKNCPSSAVKPVSASASARGSSMSSMAAQVVSETNADRAKTGLSQLTVDPELTRAACVRAQEIVSKFSHTRPNGQRGITASAKAVGENIAKGQQSAAKVMAAWMSSSGHKATILRPSLRTIGVCAYQVNGIMYWVQLFGK